MTTDEKKIPEDLNKIDLDKIDSVALRRLIEEVRSGVVTQRGAYDRVYHRHNR
jgi:hypothetical protein